MEWQNWAGNIRFNPNEMARPSNTQDVVDLVKTGRKIRCIGTGHSWSKLAPTDDILMSTDGLNKVLSIDKEKNQATIQAGAKLEDLNIELWDEGFAFGNLGSIARQSLAGAVSTATHGTGLNFQILGSMVESFILVKANGEVIEVDKAKDSELFKIALISLGSLGIITEMTFNIVPKFQLHEQSGLMDFEEVCDNILEWLKEENHIKMWWFAHTDKMMVYRYNRTQELRNDTWFRQKFMDEWVSVYFYRLLLWWSNRKPTRRKWMNRQIVNGLLPDVNRIVKGDDFALSPCYGRDSVYVGAYNADNDDWERLLSDFEELATKHNGRPHWGKEFNIDSNYLKSVYPKWDDFQKLKSELDPKLQFSNPFVSKLFSN